MMTLSEAAAMIDGSVIGRDRTFEGVSIDSRTLDAGDLFVAINGENLDGHDFVGQALARGASGAMVESVTSVAVSQLKVTDSTLALGKLAACWREKFSIPVIGVTGSNGKTTVTAMIRQIIARQHKPLFPEQSFNNQWGVPLTLLRLKDHTHAVIEMGMNHPGEINYLAQIATPTVAVINNAAAAHLEGLGDVGQVAIAKGEIIDAMSMDGIIVLNKDDEYFEFWRGQADTRKIVSFAVNDGSADFTALDIKETPTGCSFKIHSKDDSAEVSLPLPGKHNVMNALAATAAAVSAGIAMQDVVFGLGEIESVNGRLTPLQSANGATLIDDSFNANPASTAAAIEVLSQYGGRRVLVLGAMGELGVNSAAMHRETAEIAKLKGIERLVYLDDSSNPDLSGYADGFVGAERFETVSELVAALATDNCPANVFLVKGSKSSRMGRVVKHLTQPEKIDEVNSC